MATDNSSYRAGLRIASLYLRRTAEDYAEMADRKPVSLFDSEQCKEFRGKAQLLRGQAANLDALTDFEISCLARGSS